MKLSATTPTCLVLLCLIGTAIADKDRPQKQAELDKACEAAREQQLAPMRQQQIDDCVQKDKKTQAECESAFANYGARSGTRAPLFYDLPECEEAFAYKKSYRQAR